MAISETQKLMNRRYKQENKEKILAMNRKYDEQRCVYRKEARRFLKINLD